MKKAARLTAVIFGVLLLISGGSGVLASVKTPPCVSPALEIISKEIEMTRAGICGSDIFFTKDDFCEAVGVSELDGIVILKTPSEIAGKLMLGSLEVMKNQTISSENLSALRFRPSGKEVSVSEFIFKPLGGSGYSTSCTLYMLENENGAPRLEADAVLSASTYKNIAYFGNMTAYDPDGDELNFEVVTYPKKGLITVTDKSSGKFIYTPTKNYIGSDSFGYCVTDKYGNRSDEITMTVKTVRSENGTVFDDLIGKSCHNSAITISDRGVMTGKFSGNDFIFDADARMTRSEFLASAMKAAGIDPLPWGDGIVSVFSDDSEIPAEYKPYVITAVKNGIIDTKTEDAAKLTFKPNEPITLSEAAVMLNNMLGKKMPNELPTFSDAELIPEWAEEAIYSLAAAGIISPENGLISPQGNITRGQCAEMLVNVI